MVTIPGRELVLAPSVHFCTLPLTDGTKRQQTLSCMITSFSAYVSQTTYYIQVVSVDRITLCRDTISNLTRWRLHARKSHRSLEQGQTHINMDWLTAVQFQEISITVSLACIITIHLKLRLATINLTCRFPPNTLQYLFYSSTSYRAHSLD